MNSIRSSFMIFIVMASLGFGAGGAGAAIQIDAATGGDCSQVGVWDAASKTCTLTGDVLDAIHLVGDDLVLDGNGFSLEDPTPRTLFCVNLSGRRIILENLRISECRLAISSDGDYNVVRNVSATGNWRVLQVVGYQANLVENNELIANGGGFAFYGGGSHSVNNNEISGSTTWGVLLSRAGSGSVENLIANNNIRSTGAIGIIINGGGDNVVSNNLSVSSRLGVRLFGSARNVIVHNVIHDNVLEGVLLTDSPDNQVINNTISVNPVGIRFAGTESTDNRIVNNNFVSNTEQVQFPTLGWTGISIDPAGTTFAMSRRPWDLFEIETTTGQIIQKIGGTFVGFVSDIDFLESTLYASYWDGQGYLGVVDTGTGVINALGPFGLDPFDGSGAPLQNGGLAVHPDGTIYAVESSFQSGGGGATAFFKVDPSTGSAFDLLRVQLGGADPDFGLDGLEITPAGRFLATRGRGSTEVYEIDPGTGELSLIPIGGLNGSVNGLESSPAPGHLLGTTNRGALFDIDLVTGTATLLGTNVFVPVGNVFTSPAPTGGNFWSDYDSPGEGCVDEAPADGFCDSPFLFTGGQDDLPWTEPIELSLNAFFDGLLSEIGDRGADGTLNAGVGHALSQKLAAAMKSLGKQNPGAAVNELEAFINQVEALVSAGTLSAGEGQSLIERALLIIELV